MDTDIRRHALYASIEEISLAARNVIPQRYADGNPLRQGLKLHAWEISLINPINQQRVHFCAPMPLHMSKFVEQAGMTQCLPT